MQSAEVKTRAIRMVFEAIAEKGERHGVIGRVAGLVGVGRTTLRRWGGRRDRRPASEPASRRVERAELSSAQKENRELRRANEILKAASAFFAAELDRRRPK